MEFFMLASVGTPRAARKCRAAEIGHDFCHPSILRLPRLVPTSSGVPPFDHGRLALVAERAHRRRGELEACPGGS